MKKAVLLVVVAAICMKVSAQELYPVEESASNVPKNALGVRLFDEGYKEQGLLRNLAALRVMYGVTPHLSVYVTADASDYHEKTLPFDFITHNHSGGNLIAGTQTPQPGVPYPMIFNSVDAYAKYRFLTLDGRNTHFRMAAYLEGSDVVVPSHEAEPDLLVHTSGWGGGLIATYLCKRLAATLTNGFIFPSEYNGNTVDRYGGVYPTTIQYGKGVNYDLSLGYLLYPGRYKNYSQMNWNVYCEFIGKSYGPAVIYQKDGPYPFSPIYDLPITTPILKAGNYVDAVPGVQCIINSTYRCEVSMAFHIINESYDHEYPWYQVAVQRYFFFVKHKSAEEEAQ